MQSLILTKHFIFQITYFPNQNLYINFYYYIILHQIWFFPLYILTVIFIHPLLFIRKILNHRKIWVVYFHLFAYYSKNYQICIPQKYFYTIPRSHLWLGKETTTTTTILSYYLGVNLVNKDNLIHLLRYALKDNNSNREFFNNELKKRERETDKNETCFLHFIVFCF